MKNYKISILIILIIPIWMTPGCKQDGSHYLDAYNPVWLSPSPDASASMPCGGGDIGLNVWIENGDVLFYIARSGTFDENNTLLKLGRIRMKFHPNPFSGTSFRQELVLEDGYVQISGGEGNMDAQLRIWVDVFRPVIHAELSCSSELEAEVTYESWRYEDYYLRQNESFENSYKWAAPDMLVKRKDSIQFFDENIVFFHRNPDSTIFDVIVAQQAMESVKEQMYNPLADLTFGGMIRGSSLEPAGTLSGTYLDTDFMGWKLKSRNPARNHSLEIFLHTGQYPDINDWQAGLIELIEESDSAGVQAFQESRRWWNRFWSRSFISIQPEHPDSTSEPWQAGRNYQLFRYMLGCNAYGDWPTKFNGGLFSYDPGLISPDRPFTPDFRNWGGGIHTAQNQRLVYFPMLKSGDFDMMRPQLEFYRRILRNAELRSEVYWGHGGACFTEQIENFGLPNYAEYGTDRPEGYDPGMQYNNWLEYQWDTSLEFCLMILQLEEFAGRDISEYIPLIESCLSFFDQHYRYLARQRGIEELDSAGNLILYPGSSCETYKQALNATSTLAALQQILTRLLALPEPYLDEVSRDRWTAMLQTIPPIPFREIEGHTVIAPAESWERLNNTEIPQLYPVFPWRIYGLGKMGLDTALNTWKYDPDVRTFYDYVSWKQYGIMAACLGLEREALEENLKKMMDSGRRFPAFWGPGKDWVPDHNWGGSGMIGLQEMLLQTNGEKILLFPAWPAELDVHFRLHAPDNTVVEARVKSGKTELLNVSPASRMQDIIMMIE